jgi:hypothetical protein
MRLLSVLNHVPTNYEACVAAAPRYEALMHPVTYLKDKVLDLVDFNPSETTSQRIIRIYCTAVDSMIAQINGRVVKSSQSFHLTSRREPQAIHGDFKDGTFEVSIVTKENTSKKQYSFQSVYDILRGFAEMCNYDDENRLFAITDLRQGLSYGPDGNLPWDLRLTNFGIELKGLGIAPFQLHVMKSVVAACLLSPQFLGIPGTDCNKLMQCGVAIHDDCNQLCYALKPFESNKARDERVGNCQSECCVSSGFKWVDGSGCDLPSFL